MMMKVIMIMMCVIQKTICIFFLLWSRPVSGHSAASADAVVCE